MNMKRRNVDCSKLRRPLKRNKITEGIYGSTTFLYVKFLMVWLLVLMADFVLDFRFEYLWPFWLLLRSVYDSYKYQGLAFSVFFVCVAVTSDVICYLVIPVQWLFFAASTYVWVQYVWHTERGICFPTVSLWLLCVYIEASVRLRNYKPLPYHMDLCRPFAAHCIGYPVVTLGFGFKSYVSYRLRMRKQKEVERENNFYMQLLQQALPIEQQQAAAAAAAEKQKALPSKSQEDVISNGSAVTTSDGTAVSTGNGSAPSANNTANNANTQSSQQSTASSSSGAVSSSKKSNSINSATDSKRNKANNSSSSPTSTTTTSSSAASGGGGGIDDIAYIESLQPGSNKKQSHSINDFDEETMTNEHKSFKANSGVSKSTSGGGGGKVSNASSTGKDSGGKDKKGTAKTTNTYANNKDESISRLESDIKKLKADLQSSRNTEQELRSQINNYVISDKSTKSELYQLRQDNESLQGKLHNLVQSRQQDKQALSMVERKLTELRKEKTTLETQLATERRAKKAEEAATARAVAMATAARTSGECSESCKMRRREQENELKQAVRELKLREEQYRHIEREAQVLRQYKESQNDTEVLMSALAAMQDKNSHLENSLSSETRVKLDLFSALGEAKRQIEIQTTLLNCRDMEIAELKSKIAEVLALVPGSFANVAVPPGSPQNAGLATPHFSEAFACSTPPPAISQAAGGVGGEEVDMAAVLANAAAAAASSSSLNPNASDYTPKV